MLNPLEARHVARRNVLKDNLGAEISSQLLAVHAALVKLDSNENSLGQIVYFGGDQHDEDENRLGSSSHIRNTRVFDCATNQIYDPDPNFPTNDLFCCGQAFLSDGTLLTTGGTDKFPSGGHHGAFGHFRGIRSTWIFGGTPRWKGVADMNFRPQSSSRGGRWYPTLITLATGEVLAMSGHPAVGDDQGSSFRHNNNIPEKLLHRCNSRDKIFCTGSDLDSSR